jgi:hypothetical protein
MCLSKSGKLDKEGFTVSNVKLEGVQRYCYLGMEISSSGSFKLAEKTMSEKASKALFKLKSLLFNTELKPDVSMKLFDQLIKPIALYGSEIWAPDLLKSSQDERSKFNDSLGKFSSEKINLSFERFILGVHKKSQVSAVQGELGRYPLGIDITANALMYLKHLQEDTTNSLLREAFRANEQILNEKSWVGKTKKLLNYITMLNGNLKVNRKSIKRTLTAEYRAHWNNKILSETKLRTYRTFKGNFELENYLSLLPSKYRKAYTRFRISAHTLKIERGRYTRPPTPVDERTCSHCPDKVEDEFHFLLECPAYHELRITAFREIIAVCPRFSLLNSENKFLYLLSAGGRITQIIAKFIFENMN